MEKLKEMWFKNVSFSNLTVQFAPLSKFNCFNIYSFRFKTYIKCQLVSFCVVAMLKKPMYSGSSGFLAVPCVSRSVKVCTGAEAMWKLVTSTSSDWSVWQFPSSGSTAKHSRDCSFGRIRNLWGALPKYRGMENQKGPHKIFWGFYRKLFTKRVLINLDKNNSVWWQSSVTKMWSGLCWMTW